MIEYLTSTSQGRAWLPLALDPAIHRANGIYSKDAAERLAGRKRLSRYRFDESDLEGIVVPDDATIVEIRALSRDERDAAERLAGRKPRRGELLYERGERAQVAAVLAQEATGGEADAAKREASASDAVARYVDGLTEEEAEDYTAYEKWSLRRDYEVVRVALVDISGAAIGALREMQADLGAPAEGYPVEALALAAGRKLAGQRLTRTDPQEEGDDLVREIAHYVWGLSTLGKAGRRSCPSSSGGDTSASSSGPDGSATSSPE